MAYEIDTTYGGETANSYLTIEELEAQITFLGVAKGYGVDTSGWAALGSPSGENKRRLAILAADRVDCASFLGIRNYQNQRRAWPRTQTGLYHLNHIDGSVVIPDAVKLAQAAEACYLAAAITSTAQASERGVMSESVGDVTVEYSAAAMRAGSGVAISPASNRILASAGLIAVGGGSTFVPRG